MAGRRQSREARRRGIRAEVSDRDAAVLRALGRFRIARTGDLVAFAFPRVRKDTAARRLRRLFDAGYLAVRVGERSDENVYVLGPAGRAWCEAHGIAPGRTPRTDLAHHLAIVRTWVGLAVAVHTRPDATVSVIRGDWEIREHARTAPIIPDLLMEMQIVTPGRGPWPLRWAIEVDLGTETLGTLRKKLLLYETMRGNEGLFGWRSFGLGITLVGSPVRKDAVERLLRETWGGWFVVWRQNEEFAGALTTLLSRVAAPLTPSPYGEGRAPAPSDVLP